MKLRLERYSYTPHGTLGRLTLPGGRVLHTLEAPWNNNENNISCIPEGTYPVRRDRTGRFQHWRLQDVPGRTAIEIHGANYYIHPKTGKQEIQGCVTVGMELNTGYIASIRKSRPALDAMHEELGEEGWTLEITQYKPN
uniref:DUF5675 domain-containing protein n=1 Tax=Candidatus Kentrum sp. LFY TaxID=2126342 RepID=A0A450WI52_9GAMM|nr:MAG: hypothetical protein BECKLFY1418C_GA0070996_102533 [Candidatus Kentron sp. LFY]